MSFILTILMAFSAIASKSDDRAQMLLYANDPKVLKTKINSLNQLKQIEAGCNFELSSFMIPKSCYQMKLSKEKTIAVDEACERASLKMKDVVDIKGLSKTCSSFVNKKNKDIQYSQSESTPEDILR